MTAGAPPAAVTIERLEQGLGWTVIQIYGLTETAPCISICEPRPEHADLPPAERARDQGAAGRRAHHLGRAAGRGRPTTPRCRATAPTSRRDRRARQRRHGGLLQRSGGDGDRVMGGGWFHTGDAAVVHPDGYVEIRDRLKDVIISGGENISSVEVEATLLAPRAGAGSGRGRPARREVGRGAARVRRLQAGADGHGRRAARVLPRTHRALQGAAHLHAGGTSCRRPRPARSRSSCCARAGRTCRSSSPRGAGAEAAAPAPRVAGRLRALTDDLGLGLDLHQVLVADQLGDDESVGRLDPAEALAVGASHGLPVGRAADVDARPDHVLEPDRRATAASLRSCR